MKNIAIKNNICIKGELTTCGTKMLANFVPPYSATVVDKLANANITAEGLELSSDFDGSTLIDAAKRGLIALKPTRGAVSRYGLITTCPSLEEIAIISKTVDDVAELFNAIRGVDEKDSTTVVANDIEVPQEIKFGELPPIEHAATTHKIIACAEAFSNLARMDGIKFGHRSANAATLTELYENSRGEGFEYNLKQEIITGAIVLSKENRHKYYDRAIRARAKIREEVAAALSKCDVIVTLLDGANAKIANLTGLPALAIGNQLLIGAKFSEELLFQVARQIELNGAI